MLSAQNLSIEFDDCRLFKPVSFELNPGEALHVQGANGSGKSSLFKALLGLLEPSTGDVWLSGSDHETLQDIAGFIGHKLGLNPMLTVAENVHFTSLGEQTRLTLEQALEQVGLTNYADTLVSMLSQGQKKRASLARFFYSQKSIWLLDEPFSALDKFYQEKLAQGMSEYLRLGGALMVSSHQSFKLDNLSLKYLSLS